MSDSNKNVLKSIFEPVLTFKGEGKLATDSICLNVNFQCRQLQNGRIAGEILTQDITMEPAVWKIFDNHEEFVLEGMDLRSGSKVVVNRCVLVSFSSKESWLEARFNAFELIQNPERLKDMPTNPLVVVFGVLNVDETFRVIVDTPLGKLYLAHVKDRKEILDIVKSRGVSTITAYAEIHIAAPERNKTFSDILQMAQEVMEGFLQISRLAQTCYHEWCNVSIYQKGEDSESFNLVLLKLSKPKGKQPSYRGITNPAHSSYFFESAYRGYNPKLNETYSFDIALEWYLEANLASVLESKFLAACTCLELLVSKHNAATNSKFILDPNKFSKLLGPLESVAMDIMKELEISNDKVQQICIKLSGLNRRTFKEGIESLLQSLGIKYGDMNLKLQEVIDFRNKIVHTGIFSTHVLRDFKRLSDCFNKLYVVLTRIFLSILNYDHDYFDWIRGDWVHFKEVCTKS